MPYFEGFISQDYHDDYKQYAQRVKGKSKNELMKEFIEWAIKLEKSYGFANPKEEREILGKYEAKLAELNKP